MYIFTDGLLLSVKLSVRKCLLLTLHVRLTADLHKLRCKASESSCQVVCLLAFGVGLSVQSRIKAGRGIQYT